MTLEKIPRLFDGQVKFLNFLVHFVNHDDATLSGIDLLFWITLGGPVTPPGVGPLPGGRPLRGGPPG